MALRRRKVLTIKQRQHRSLRMWGFSILALLMLVVLNTCDAQADEITDNVAAMLTADSSMPLAPGVAIELASNLMVAQDTSSYAASEPDSLTLSFASVLRAIWLEGTLFDETEITDVSTLAVLQSQIAIDDRVSLEIFVNGVEYVPGEVINFGDVVVTPEPAEGIMTLMGVDLLLFCCWMKRKKKEKEQPDFPKGTFGIGSMENG